MKISNFTILTLLTLFSSTLFSIITPMAKELTIALNLISEEQITFVNSMFLLTAAFCSLIWAILGDKFSRKTLLLIATLEWAIFTLITITATNFLSLLIFQICTAIGFSAALPLTFSLIIDLVEPQRRGEKFGSLSAVYVLGNGLGQMFSGFLIDFYAWQVPILIVSISGFACVGLLFLFQEPVKGVMDDTLQEAKNNNTVALDYKLRMKDLKVIWKNKSTMLILILNFIMFIAIGAISSFLISMLKNDYQFPSALATVFLIMIFGGQVPSGPFFGKKGDKLRESDKNGRIKIILLCLVAGSCLYIIAYALIFTINDLVMVIIFLVLTFVGAFFFGGIDPLAQATLGEITPPQVRSTIYSLNYLTYTIGRSISLLLLGQFFIAFNNLYRPGYFILSILALSSSLILIPILKFLPNDIDKANNNT